MVDRKEVRVMGSLRGKLLLLRLKARVRTVRTVKMVRGVRLRVTVKVREGTVPEVVLVRPLLVLEPNLNAIYVRNLGVSILIIVSVLDATSAASSAMSTITANTVQPIRSTL